MIIIQINVDTQIVGTQDTCLLREQGPRVVRTLLPLSASMIKINEFQVSTVFVCLFIDSHKDKEITKREI